MSTLRWVGNNGRVAQVQTFTFGGTWIAAETITVTYGTKSWTYAITSATIATFLPLLATAYEALSAADYPEFQEQTASSTSTTIVLTADTAGRPFTVTISTNSSSGTINSSSSSTGTATTAPVSPNDVNSGSNYDSGSVPANTNDLVIDAGAVDMLYNIGSLSGVTLTSLIRRAGYTGAIGLQEYSASGYFEYRATEFAISATTMLIEQNQQDGTAGIKFNVGSVQTTLTVLGQSAAGIGVEAMWWRGTHASNVVSLLNASLAVATVDGQTAVIATLNATGSTVRTGTGTTLTTVNLSGSTMEINSAATTVTLLSASNLTIKKAGTITTLKVLDGTATHQGTATITTLTVGPAGTMDFSQGTGAVTITNAVLMSAGATYNDPMGRTTPVFTLAAGVGIEDVTIVIGKARTLTIS